MRLWLKMTTFASKPKKTSVSGKAIRQAELPQCTLPANPVSATGTTQQQRAAAHLGGLHHGSTLTVEHRLSSSRCSRTAHGNAAAGSGGGGHRGNAPPPPPPPPLLLLLLVAALVMVARLVVVVMMLVAVVAMLMIVVVVVMARAAGAKGGWVGGWRQTMQRGHVRWPHARARACVWCVPDRDRCVQLLLRVRVRVRVGGGGGALWVDLSRCASRRCPTATMNGLGDKKWGQN